MFSYQKLLTCSIFLFLCLFLTNCGNPTQKTKTRSEPVLDAQDSVTVSISPEPALVNEPVIAAPPAASILEPIPAPGPLLVPGIISPLVPPLLVPPGLGQFDNNRGGHSRDTCECLESGCEPCKKNSDCEDKNPCTSDRCTEGTCLYEPVPGCAFCETASDCGDIDSCTTDLCISNTCSYVPVPGCALCETAADCIDANPCTTASCDMSRCSFTPVLGCAFCNLDSDCLPGPQCTMATCAANVCTYPEIPGCRFLVAIEVTPANYSISVGTDLQYTATAIFSDASTLDITSVATWTSDPGFATISDTQPNKGLATGVANGTTIISASFLNIVGSTNLTVGCQTAPADLVGWWPGDDTPDDISVFQNDGTFTANTYTAGEVSQAFSFAGNDTSFVDIDNIVAYETQTLSVDAWVKANPQGDFKYILNKGYDADCDPGVASYAFYTGDTGGLFFYVSDGTAPVALSPDAGTGIWDNQWHFITGTYDGTTIRLYVDAVEVGLGTVDPTTIDYTFDDNSLTFGDYRGCPGFSYSGGLDEVEIFSRVLTPAEITSIFNAQSLGKCKP